MESPPVYKRTHPMVPIAAASVIVMSLIGVGVFTGVIPTHMSSQAQTQPLVASASGTAPAPMDTPAPMYSPPPAYAPSPSPGPAYEAPAGVPAPPPAQAMPALAPLAAGECYSCGRVEYVQTVESLGKPTGVGAVAGGVGGALLGNQLGHRSSRGPLTILGAVGGAFAGNAIEKHVHKQISYRVHVRMDDGTPRSFSAGSPGAYSAGERVRVENGGLVPIG
ncbi:MAG TPA: glycine zipper 2TM domain-containing protein [Burkholderiales bacterium]|jgi:outer membrane lipoprotein SlyB|nr:glycine zipper 2TM domain-containing protein [Burkholderiales bacterium]